MIDLKAVIGGSAPVGSERWFHKKAGNPLHEANGNTYLRSGNIMVGEQAAYPEAFANFKISQGTVWATIPVFTNQVLWFIKFVGDRWFAGGAGGVLFTSLDGVSWTAITHSAGTVTFSDIAYGNGTYVITVSTSSTQCLYSLDGLNWSKSAAYTAGVFNAITWFKGYFIAVGSSARAMRSADGITWTAITTPLSTSYSYTSICTDGEKFLATSINYGGVHGASDPLATSWNLFSFSPGNTTSPYDIEYGDGHWVVGQASTYFSVSADGVLWKSYNNLPGITSGATISTVTYGAGMFLLTTNGGQLYKVTFDKDHVPVVTGSINQGVSRKAGYGKGLFIQASTIANVAPRISYADSIGLASEASLAGGEVIKYLRIK